MADPDDCQRRPRSRVTPPRWGKGVERPRVDEAKETAARTAAVLADIDQLLPALPALPVTSVA